MVRRGNLKSTNRSATTYRRGGQRRLSPGASRLVTSAIASADGWKYFRTFSGFLCRDFAISIGRLAPPSPRCVSPECRYSCRSQPMNPGTLRDALRELGIPAEKGRTFAIRPPHPLALGQQQTVSATSSGGHATGPAQSACQ